MKKIIFDIYEIDSNGYVINKKRQEKVSTRLTNGYLRLNLYVKKKKMAFYLHRLMAKTFIPDYNPLEHNIVFKDNDKTNCSLDNLVFKRIDIVIPNYEKEKKQNE